MRTVRRLLTALPFLLALAACETPEDTTGSWQPPKARLPINTTYPVCATNLECLWGEHCDATDAECIAGVPPGRVGAAIDFTLPDENEHSQTFGDDVALSGQHGLVTVLYFGLSTCPVCWQQVVRLQSLLEELAASGTPDVTALVIDHTQGDGQVWAMARFTRLPILQDQPATRTVWDRYGAEKDTFVVVDPGGFVQASWKTLRILDTQKDVADLRQAILDAAK